jgi:hypothetical protein
MKPINTHKAHVVLGMCYIPLHTLSFHAVQKMLPFLAIQLIRDDLSKTHQNIPCLFKILQNLFYATMLSNELQGPLPPNTYEKKNVAVNEL